MTHYKKEFRQCLLYFIPLITIELLFRILNQHNDQGILFIRSFLYCLFLANILYFLNKHSKKLVIKIITIFVFIFNSIYAFFQTGIHYYYGHFFSVRFLFLGTPDVGSYKIDFLLYIKPSTYIFLFLGFLFSILYIKYNDKTKQKHNLNQVLLSLVFIALSYLIFIISLLIADPKNIFESTIELYRRPYYTENAINQIGMSAFIPSDLYFSTFSKQSIQIEEDHKKEDEEIVEKVDPLLEGRIMDDEEWKKLKDEEGNENIKAIDNYFLNKNISKKNDKTGIYKDKNFIYVLVEAFDMIAIDEKLTPNLHKLKNEGTYFDHFYSPQFNCATAESELMSLTSLYPVIDTCTMSAYYDRSSPQTIFKLFKAENYQTSSYHNWNDQFYPRSEIHPVLGSDEYIDVDTLIPYLISGWQSDLTMMEGIVKDLNNKDGKFMSYIITSSTHLPYDEDSALGNRYLNQVNAIYPNAPREIKTYLSKSIELDKAIEHLLTNLEDIDNTVIMLFGDHRPLKMPAQYLENHSPIPRLKQHELDRTPMIIYTPNQNAEIISTVSSTIDMAPTIANLFDLKHDTRLFMGNDIFNEEENIVIFQNASWYNQLGYFSSANANFTPFNEDKTMTDEEVQNINKIVKKKLNVSSLIYTEDYFSNRKNIERNIFNHKDKE